MLVAFNLRPAVVAVGPLLRQIQGDLGLSGVAAGALTTLPVLFFGSFGLAAPFIRRSLRGEFLLVTSMGLLIVALFARAIPAHGGAVRRRPAGRHRDQHRQRRRPRDHQARPSAGDHEGHRGLHGRDHGRGRRLLQRHGAAGARARLELAAAARCCWPSRPPWRGSPGFRGCARAPAAIQPPEGGSPQRVAVGARLAGHRVHGPPVAPGVRHLRLAAHHLPGPRAQRGGRRLRAGPDQPAPGGRRVARPVDRAAAARPAAAGRARLRRSASSASRASSGRRPARSGCGSSCSASARASGSRARCRSSACAPRTRT